MDLLNQEPNIKHHQWPNYYDRKEELKAKIRLIHHWIEEDNTDNALEVLADIEIRLRNLKRG